MSTAAQALDSERNRWRLRRDETCAKQIVGCTREFLMRSHCWSAATQSKARNRKQESFPCCVNQQKGYEEDTITLALTYAAPGCQRPGQWLRSPQPRWLALSAYLGR
jgi:hypothetical protein